ncbi:MAG TPA: TetR/AcrR family transcriptional regulator [Solirubrobacteraceae bacterium]|jgi:AcrR family transcriptional regulator|nr:TetR/AcrR family transcriptional regulator [Solirubrobacteraceae bacterium]
MGSTRTVETPQKSDGRRDVGERTRQRLLEATRELLAERGEDAIRLRDITEAAQVNVAAVNYHFGCLKALYNAAIKEAFETIINESIDQLAELSDDATLEEIVTAWVGPAIAARLGPQCEKRAFMRITARASSHPPEELCEWMAATLARFHDELVARLSQALPGVPESELRFRVACAGGILHVLRTDGMQAELEHVPPSEVQRLLIPVISGALGARA